MMRIILFFLHLITVFMCINSAKANDQFNDEFRIKREANYEFAEKPSLKIEKDKIEITFETAGYCDVTVAIENSSGTIVRHLGSGVLGKNAPEPFSKNSKKQVLNWDGKDDLGVYIDDKNSHVVRVSLGIKPQFERTLFWSPHKRIGTESPSMAASKEGVYVYGNWDGLDFIHLFDHDGNYLRNIYPFPKSKVKEVNGLFWQKNPRDGINEFVHKRGYLQGTLLSSGKNSGFVKNIGYGDAFAETGPSNLPSEQDKKNTPNYGDVAAYAGPASLGIAVHEDRIALAYYSLNRLKTDSTTGQFTLKGPSTKLLFGKNLIGPRSFTFAPDGKTIYLTNFFQDFQPGQVRTWTHGVAKINYEGKEDEQMKVFLGNLTFDSKSKGNDENSFNCPVAVECDSHGNVYVADHFNNRVQVFSSKGVFLKSLKVDNPAQVCVSKKTGSIYVFTWRIDTQFMGGDKYLGKPMLTKFHSLEKPQVEAVYPISLVEGMGQSGTGYKAIIDDFGAELTVWLVPGNSWTRTSNVTTFSYWEKSSIQLLREKNGKLINYKSFGEITEEKLKRQKPAVFFRQVLHVNPKTGYLYIAEGSFHNKATPNLIKINPVTGLTQIEPVPFDAEDFCFSADGLAYMRNGTHVARFDPTNWREIPWDYGEEVKMTYANEKVFNAISALRTPGHNAEARNHNGGMAVSLNGNLVVTTCTTHNKAPEYLPHNYPGRYRWGEIHIFDKHGTFLFKDAIPGMNVVDGIGIDTKNNIYAMSQARRVFLGKNFPNHKSEVLVKFKAGEGKVLSSSVHTTAVPLPLQKAEYPKRDVDISGSTGIGGAWMKGAEWFYGGVGFDAGNCVCWNARFTLDYFARSFAPEPDRYSVAVLDSNGNLILNIGQYGNVDDGKPLIENGGPSKTNSIGGDETALFHANYLATHTDQRLFIADQGNARVVSVKLNYHTEEKVKIK